MYTMRFLLAAVAATSGLLLSADAADKPVDGMITAPDGRKQAWIKDSEGNTLCLLSARP